MTDTSVEKSSKPWQFQKGKASANPVGRPKGQRDFVTELIQSMRRKEAKEGKLALDQAWDMAWGDPKMLTSLLRKLIPDLQHTTGDGLAAVVNIYRNYREDNGSRRALSPVRDGNGRVTEQTAP